MIDSYNVVDTILFSESSTNISEKLRAAKKDYFEPNDRIVIVQDVNDTYPYIDAAGSKLIELQKIINGVDISNCFILLVTANTDIKQEIDFITKFYSIDPTPINFSITDGDYKKEIIQYQDTSCVKLWNHLYVGTDGNINPCCVADHRFPLGNINNSPIKSIIYSDKSNQIREWMSQGFRSIACSPCYLREDNRIASARRPCDSINQNITITDLDIRVNNICNFKCRMCSEYFSSAIQQETLALYGKNPTLGYEKISLDRVNRQTLHDRLEKILPLVTRDLRTIRFAGGEPLIMSEHYEILDRLIEIQNTDIAILYTTNLSTLSYKQYSVIDRWGHFDHVTVEASIDASGMVAEYLRHGTIWHDIVTNIHVIKQNAPHVQLKIASTVSCLNIENLIELQRNWLDQHLFSINDLKLQVLTSPDFLSPAMLPAHHKQRLSKIIRAHIDDYQGTKLAQQWTDVLQWMNNNDFTFARKEFVHRTQVLDQHRNESFKTTFPQFIDLI